MRVVEAEQSGPGVQALVDGASQAWVTHRESWRRTVDLRAGAAADLCVQDDIDGVVAFAPLADTGDALVCGVIDPAGLLLHDDLDAAQQFRAVLLLAEQARDRAAAAGRAGVLVKESVMTRQGARAVLAPKVLALSEAGYRTVARTFFCHTDATRETAERRLSSRLRTQLHGAAEQFTGRPVHDPEEREVFARVHAAHSAAKGTTCPFDVTTLAALTADPATETVPLLYRDAEGEVAGFALTVRYGRAGEVVTWGSVDPVATSRHLTKLIVWDAMTRLLDAGARELEYGCRFDGVEYGGLTEFYRRFGGEERGAVWAWCPTRP